MIINPHVQSANVWKTPARDGSPVLLDLNENQFLEAFFERFIRHSLQARDLRCYPDYNGLLDALGRYCAVPPGQLLLTNGADQAIDLILRLVFSPGQRVVVPSPVFAFYYQMLAVHGLEAVQVRYRRADQRFHLCIEAVEQALEGSHGLILCNPNNPLGVALEPETLRRLIHLSAEQGKPVIVDECYFEYLRFSCLEVAERLDNLFVVRSFSKYFGLAGLRLGYVIAHPEQVRQLLKVRGPWDINHVAVKAAQYCLREWPTLEHARHRLLRAKARLIQHCRRIGITVIDTEANFVLLQDLENGRIHQALLKAGVRVSDCTSYPGSAGMLRGILRMAIPGDAHIDLVLEALTCGARGCPPDAGGITRGG